MSVEFSSIKGAYDVGLYGTLINKKTQVANVGSQGDSGFDKCFCAESVKGTGKSSGLASPSETLAHGQSSENVDTEVREWRFINGDAQLEEMELLGLYFELLDKEHEFMLGGKYAGLMGLSEYRRLLSELLNILTTQYAEGHEYGEVKEVGYE